MDELFGGDCAACGHPWSWHPVALAGLRGCVLCVEEEDHDQRDDICAHWPPDAEIPAAEVVRATVRRGRWGWGRLTFVLPDGSTWAVARRGHWTVPDDVARVEHELVTTTLGAFWERHYLGFR
ncbi:hypothetical protein [Isoptericola sp. NPDC058082]|uniref:hypothetical protein n=1 Tax=Isoptericola sp. NPDC058082 TaxID=3346331 RepID=UPI0036E9C140